MTFQEQVEKARQKLKQAQTLVEEATTLLGCTTCEQDAKDITTRIQTLDNEIATGLKQMKEN